MSFQDIQGGPHPAARRNQSPSQAVAAGIFQINTAVATFRRLVDALGTVKDTSEHRQKLYGYVTHTHTHALSVILLFLFFSSSLFFVSMLSLCCVFLHVIFGRHNTRQRILQLVKDTSAKLKSLSESDRDAGANVRFDSLLFPSSYYYFLLGL